MNLERDIFFYFFNIAIISLWILIKKLNVKLFFIKRKDV